MSEEDKNKRVTFLAHKRETRAQSQDSSYWKFKSKENSNRSERSFVEKQNKEMFIKHCSSICCPTFKKSNRRTMVSPKIEIPLPEPVLKRRKSELSKFSFRSEIKHSNFPFFFSVSRSFDDSTLVSSAKSPVGNAT